MESGHSTIFLFVHLFLKTESYYAALAGLELMT